MKNRKFHSFSNRLTRRLVLTLLVILGLASLLIFIVGGSFAFDDENMRHESMLQVSAEKINRVASDIYVASRTIVPEIEESLDRPDRMMKLVERLIAQNPRIRSCGISFVESYYPQKGRCYMPYAVRRDSTTIDVMDLSSKRGGYLNEEWFLQSLQAEEGIWSEPFLEGTESHEPLVAFLHPIRDKQGRTVAVLGADLSLQWLQEKVSHYDWQIFSNQWGGMNEERRERSKKERRPYSFLISKKGTFLVHPDDKLLGRGDFSTFAKACPDTTLAFVGREMMAGKSSADMDYALEAEIDGRDYFLFFTPIKHAKWSLGLVVPWFSLEMIAFIVGGSLALLVLISLLAVWLVSRSSIRRATNPLKQLAFSADEVAKGNFDASLPDIKHNDEILQLRDSFDDMQQSLKDYVEELKTTTASKAAIENELKVAHDIQMAMLPKIFPPYPERKDIDIYGLLNPAKDVGGDLFDFYIRQNQLFFCIGDVSGKGVPASLLMAVTRSLFRNVSTHTFEPEEIVSAINEALAEGNETNMFVTFFVGVLNLETGFLSFCNAGHDAPLLIGQGVGLLPCEANLPIGVMPGTVYKRQEADIMSQTTIFLYTDGLNEAEDIHHTQFGIQRLQQLAESMLANGENEPSKIITKMEDAVRSFVAGAEQSDDLTMLAIKWMKDE